MAKIYENQSITIELDLATDLSGATTLEVRYKSPTSLRGGSWVAAIVPGTNKVTVDVPKNILSPAGAWKLQGYAAGTGWSMLGETVTLTISAAFN
jgi:hypothetical protein